MSYWVKITVKIALWAILPVLFTSCWHGIDNPVSKECYYIKLSLSASAIQQTRSDSLTLGNQAEARLHSLQVWVFNSGEEQNPIAYESMDEDQLNAYTDSYGNIALVLPIKGERLSVSRSLDFYIAANAVSANVHLDENATRAGLESASFSLFTPDVPTQNVPSGGLPISRIIKNVNANLYLSSVSKPSHTLDIPLLRAVSKVHFYFVRPEGLTGASIRRIEMNGTALPIRECLFPLPTIHSENMQDPATANIVSGAGYHTGTLVLTPQETDIYEYNDPKLLIRQPGEAIQHYINRLSLSSVRDFGLTYLKETDREISGTIYYTTPVTGNVEQQVSFSLGANSFLRNREWIVYAFFSKDRLYLHPLVADWSDGGVFSFEWGYSSTLINQTGAENTSILTVGGQDYVMSAFGLSPSGLPYAPKLQLDASCTESAQARMLLHLDNPDFGFIESEGGVLSPIKDDIELILSSVPTSVIFYVVPKRQFDLAGPNPENPIAALRLYLISDRLASVRLPFNVISMPGDQEQILFHYVTPDQFN